MTKRGTGLALLLGVSAGLGACNVAGPSALRSGRSIYNTVINATEDEQVLSVLVRRRYDETFSMLTVASVTASISVGASLGGNAGIGASSSYEGNLVPLSAGLTYEENPTISYVPLKGERLISRMLSPIGLDEAILVGRAGSRQDEFFRLVLLRVNGISNPLFRPEADGARFDRFVTLLGELRDGGALDFMQTDAGKPVVYLHNSTGEMLEEARELLGLLGIDKTLEAGGELALPLHLAAGARRPDAVEFETPSVIEIIAAAAAGVRAPEAHIADGIAAPVPSATDGRVPFVRVNATKERPRDAMVAVSHRGWWFWIDSRDTTSKRGFVALRALINMRLDDPDASAQSPVLTLPVGN